MRIHKLRSANPARRAAEYCSPRACLLHEPGNGTKGEMPMKCGSSPAYGLRRVVASIAITIAQTAIETCKANGYAVSATVVGRNGEIIVQVRGDNTGPHTLENSMRKAYTARTFRSPSGALVERLKADPTLGLIHLTNVIANQGALPIKVG